jgi:hypothetical protein
MFGSERERARDQKKRIIKKGERFKKRKTKGVGEGEGEGGGEETKK